MGGRVSELLGGLRVETDLGDPGTDFSNSFIDFGCLWTKVNFNKPERRF